jgi:hypothetical protein
MIRPQPLAELAKYVVAPQGMEILHYTYFSRKLISAGVLPAETQFFADQVGVGGATSRDTNMTKPSAIGNPRSMLVQFITCAVYNVTAAQVILAGVAQAAQQLLYQTFIRVDLLDKEYLTIPTYMVPAGGGLYVNGVGAALNALGVSNGTPEKKNCLNVELPLEREASFVFRMVSSAATITLGVDMHIEMAIHGLLLRPRQ